MALCKKTIFVVGTGVSGLSSARKILMECATLGIDLSLYLISSPEMHDDSNSYQSGQETPLSPSAKIGAFFEVFAPKLSALNETEQQEYEAKVGLWSTESWVEWNRLANEFAKIVNRDNNITSSTQNDNTCPFIHTLSGFRWSDHRDPLEPEEKNFNFAQYRLLSHPEFQIMAKRFDLPDSIKYGIYGITLIAENPEFMEWLNLDVQKRGGKIVWHRLRSLKELTGSQFLQQYHLPAPDAIINCCGIGAATLVPDPHMIPISGQIITTKLPQIFQTNENVNTKNEFQSHADPTKNPLHLKQFHVVHPEDMPASLLPSPLPPGLFLYLFPRRRDLLIGGTAFPDDWNQHADPVTTHQILQAANTLLPALHISQLPIIGVAKRLRPARTRGIRIECERVEGTLVVHNYGHSGSGATLCFGCANEVWRLLDGVLALSCVKPSKL